MKKLILFVSLLVCQVASASPGDILTDASGLNYYFGNHSMTRTEVVTGSTITSSGGSSSCSTNWITTTSYCTDPHDIGDGETTCTASAWYTDGYTSTTSSCGPSTWLTPYTTTTTITGTEINVARVVYSQSVSATTASGSFTPAILDQTMVYDTMCIIHSTGDDFGPCDFTNLDHTLYLSTYEGPEVGGLQLSYNDVSDGDIVMKRKAFVPPNDEFVRWLNIFTNNGAETTTIRVGFGSDTGHDTDMYLIGSDVSANERPVSGIVDDPEGLHWVAYMRAYSGSTSAAPRQAVLLVGPGEDVVELSAVNFVDSEGSPWWSYELTLDAGETKTLMEVMISQPSKAITLAKSMYFATFPGTYLQGMTREEIDLVSNFNGHSVADQCNEALDVEGSWEPYALTGTPCLRSDDDWAPGTCDDGICGTLAGLAPSDDCAEAFYGAPCDDESDCTMADHCNIDGECVGVLDLGATTCTGDGPGVYACTRSGTCESTEDAPEDCTPCDDGNACTTDETYQDGICTGGIAVTCTASDPCHNPAACDPDLGCVPEDETEKDEGDACQDGDLCTVNETCQEGVCTGGDPVTCSASDDCHERAACEPDVGCPPETIKDNGTSCDDDNVCTTNDVCISGMCTSGSSVSCTPSDQCHEAGSCDPVSGCSSDIPKANGSPCDDGDACTAYDTCQSGTCSPGSSVTCNPTSQCYEIASCNSGSGCPDQTPKEAGSPCNDYNRCTTDDVCDGGGQCAGTVNPACHGPVCEDGMFNCHSTCVDLNSDNLRCGDCANPCGSDEMCFTGECISTLCSLDDLCRPQIFDEDLGTCVETIADDGTECNDHDADTSDDICTLGECAGTVIIDTVPEDDESSSTSGGDSEVATDSSDKTTNSSAGAGCNNIGIDSLLYCMSLALLLKRRRA